MPNNIIRSVTAATIVAIVLALLTAGTAIGATYIHAGADYLDTLKARAAANGTPLFDSRTVNVRL